MSANVGIKSDRTLKRGKKGRVRQMKRITREGKYYFVDPSKYMPHQGEQECARRRRQRGHQE
jgi:hypothetical protein